MTQNTNHTAQKITELVTAIAKHGSLAAVDISHLHVIVPDARLEILGLVDEADSNIALLATVETLGGLLEDLRHRVTVRHNLVTHSFVEILISTAVAYGFSVISGRDTAKHREMLDSMRHDLEEVGSVELFDVAVRYGLNRARRQRSARMIKGFWGTIRDLAK